MSQQAQTWGELLAAGVDGGIDLAGRAVRGAQALLTGEVSITEAPAIAGRGLEILAADTATGAQAVGETAGETIDAIPGAIRETARTVQAVALLAVVAGGLYLFGRR